jgi:peptidoglycan/xylan/chitin deacetylase (PgdA/CDA1 family)
MITTVNPPAGSATWTDLQDELDRWRQCGRCATLWWRDDDAVAPSRRLDELLKLAGEIPLALAVIPAQAEAGLPARLDASPQAPIRVLQHGWRHRNYAAGGKKSEFPPSRPHVEISADLARGRERLKALFGSRALPVLAPPWNRFGSALLPLVAAAGIGAISQLNPRPSAWAAAGVFAVNAHIDLVAWRGGRGFIGEGEALGALVGHLRARRERRADPDEPTGILTHHLVQDEATGVFLGRLVDVTRAHSAARWLGAGEVFAPGIDALGVAGRA